MPSSGARADRIAQIRWVLWALLVANLAVVIVKFAIGLRTGSLAVLGDAVHSSVDAANNVFGLVVMRVAALGPDEDHPYGHSKFETLGALAIVLFLSVSGFELVKGAITRLIAGPEPLAIGVVHIGLLAATLVVNMIVATYRNATGQRAGQPFAPRRCGAYAGRRRRHDRRADRSGAILPWVGMGRCRGGPRRRIRHCRGCLSHHCPFHPGIGG